MKIFKIILGTIMVLAQIIHFPETAETITSFRSDNSQGLAAIAGTLIAHILIWLVAISLIHSGLKTKKQDEKN